MQRQPVGAAVVGGGMGVGVELDRRVGLLVADHVKDGPKGQIMAHDHIRRKGGNFDSKPTFPRKEKIKIEKTLAFYCRISIFANGIVHKTLKFNLLLQKNTHPAQKTVQTMHSVFRNHTNY